MGKTEETPTTSDSIVIVGAGVFGLSLALEFKKRGYRSVEVLDRHLPPVPDGSSVDVSRVIRIDYADPLYSKMAAEAHKIWVSEYREHFHNTGFVMLMRKDGNDYAQQAVETVKDQGFQYQECDTQEDLKRLFPSVTTDMTGLKGFVNEIGGWADAEGSIRQLSAQCKAAGVEFVAGLDGTVTSLIYDRARVVGLNTLGAKSIYADRVILATGAWTNRLLPVSQATTASGQPVGFIQLTKHEADSLKAMPVIINLSTGVFVFPPTPESNILKFARHSYGFASQIAVDDGSRVISSPKLESSNAESSFLPDDADKALREGVAQLIPNFSHLPWARRRLCWYSDTPDGDFIIDHHPKLDGLFIATGGAGQ